MASMIPMKEFAGRRRKLMERMAPDSIAILPAAPERVRNRDVLHPFRQDSDFQYLTGFGEPEAVLALIPGREHGEAVLFCRERNPEKELWDGFLVGQDGAIEQYGLDDAFPIADIDDILPGLLEGRSRVYYPLGKDPAFDNRVMDWVKVIRSKVRAGAHPPGEFVALEHLLHDMRLIKSPAEIKVMAKAGKISAEAHSRAMKRARRGGYEYQLEAELIHTFMEHGARNTAYPSIVGSGANACILHYIENSAPLKDGDLVLIDAGCELECYASDITRTFPVSGRFSAEQAALYNVVLEAQYAAIDAVKPGNHWNQPHEAALEVLTQGLIDLGLLTGNVEDAIAEGAYRPFFMHRTGHWLGMDVHDVGDYKIGDAWRLLEPGMALTVEPGLYVAPDNTDVDEKWRGIGIRIEDDVVVTKEGCRILTDGVPKTIPEIEALMAD
ncbi:aminopeptidase P Metallo peptidase. MEROPS family M24B [Marinobacter persicus]|uniref:Xaa-Pro aminopeptidase n=1 Tax=Marinobacter persicus TaxID=930118 RepID=A0A1I3R0C7_9GAMM|nr:Xaa-Pro aminopeptidase [Marinobacter persicus]GHD43347.1 Xaa-Pro aminopeptidase [Marinobacter persicus]SFJ39798.1 aminopeptidase P Metallo peptidase. MEROPS family M24B [Marinobacter persicus]